MTPGSCCSLRPRVPVDGNDFETRLKIRADRFIGKDSQMYHGSPFMNREHLHTDVCIMRARGE